MLHIYQQFEKELKSESDSQVRWMRNDQEDTLSKLPKGNHLRDKHMIFLELAEKEMQARGL